MSQRRGRMGEAADDARSAILASLSHELRTPLNAIIGFAELLEERAAGPLTERQQKYVRNIASSGRHLLDLINQVLELPKVGPTLSAPVVAAGTPSTSSEPLVLIVEDDRQMSDLLVDYVTEAGYATARAGTAEEALRLARELKPAAITLDIALPDRNGLEVLGALRQLPEIRETPVVVVSVADRRSSASRAGPVAWLVKPVDRAGLLAILRRVIPEKRP